MNLHPKVRAGAWTALAIALTSAAAYFNGTASGREAVAIGLSSLAPVVAGWAKSA